jgi:hypothetical protein
LEIEALICRPLPRKQRRKLPGNPALVMGDTSNGTAGPTTLTGHRQIGVFKSGESTRTGVRCVFTALITRTHTDDDTYSTVRYSV